MLRTQLLETLLAVSGLTDTVKSGATRDQLAMQVRAPDLGGQRDPQFFVQPYAQMTRKR